MDLLQKIRLGLPFFQCFLLRRVDPFRNGSLLLLGRYLPMIVFLRLSTHRLLDVPATSRQRSFQIRYLGVLCRHREEEHLLVVYHQYPLSVNQTVLLRNGRSNFVASVLLSLAIPQCPCRQATVVHIWLFGKTTVPFLYFQQDLLIFHKYRQRVLVHLLELFDIQDTS